MKTFDDFINEGLEYTDFFGKQVSHKEALLDKVKSHLIHILAEERQISEKDFTRYDQIMDEATAYLSSDPVLINEANTFYESNRRLQLLAEMIYEKMNSK